MSPRLRRALLLAAGLALAAASSACGRNGITAEQARQTTEDALSQGAVGGFEVTGDVRRGPCPRVSPARDGWTTTVLLDRGGRVEMCVAVADGEPVILYDEGADGSGPALTDAEFQRIDDYDPPAPFVSVGALLTAAALLAADVAGLVFVVQGRRRAAVSSGP